MLKLWNLIGSHIINILLIKCFFFSQGSQKIEQWRFHWFVPWNGVKRIYFVQKIESEITGVFYMWSTLSSNKNVQNTLHQKCCSSDMSSTNKTIETENKFPKILRTSRAQTWCEYQTAFLRIYFDVCMTPADTDTPPTNHTVTQMEIAQGRMLRINKLERMDSMFLDFVSR